jgi:hypothetical protein
MVGKAPEGRARPPPTTQTCVQFEARGEPIVVAPDCERLGSAKLWAVALAVSFVRYLGKRDHIYVTRQDGTSCDWGFPTYGDQLPHDLCHLVIEEMLEIPNGFWGLVEQGMEVRLIDDQGVLMIDGRPLSDRSDFDFSDLVRAEEAVALLAPTGMQFEQLGALVVASRTDAEGSMSLDVAARLRTALPPECSAQLARTTRERLHDLREQWRGLDDGEAITLSFTRSVR